ncbi:iron-containing alcohol dehydrogenase [Lacrimispora sp.]|uniref:iron-containing alcohol dehydrogenase n=1 Tax=Lacrimispora sp. TaxID=2719234 RepID=UPI0028B0783A|nr:iron-containing alcohol dehydrogenase [Lacrimispora sp.]
MQQTFSILSIPKFITGRGSVSFITSLEKKRIGIIRGGRSYNKSLREKIEMLAAESGAKIQYLAQIRNEPSIDDIFRCMEEVRSFEPDMILAIGGGSVLDTAKAIHLLYENPDMEFKEALIPFTLPKLGKRAVHVSVPTTSGTGSEATSAAVFIDPLTKVKKLLLDNHLIPHYAVLDADLTDSLPDCVRITTAMDALTHAIEASTAANASVMTRAIALEAAIDIMENLPGSLNNCPNGSVQALSREKIHIASAMAGVAITNSCTGLAHSYDHPGPAFSKAHGAVCGLMLPYTMELCGTHPSYATLAARLGYQGNEKELTQHLIDHLFRLRESLSLELTFEEMGIDRIEYFNRVETWSKVSLDAIATVVSPVEMTIDRGMELYDSCYYGKRPIV